ncbi:MAG: 3-deoxy-7-phosphoheptulonate synthase class II [Rhodobacterales bacterium]|nr:3-deoxy-7-phosphoheptulonate synthase class II [Rhodobacterales bacterium]
MIGSWDKSSWRTKKRHQMPEYKDLEELNKVENSLKSLPPLVFAGEVRNLKKDLAKVESGQAFLLQGGDCAESFEEFSADLIRDTFKVLLKMAVVLTFGGKKPVIKIGRMAGQFAKPRSSDFEIINGQKLPSYRGDIINDIEPTIEHRLPKPERMLKAYTQSSSTLNLLRAFSQGGFADISRVHSWVLESTKGQVGYQKFFDLATKITNSLEFMSAAGVNSENSDSLRKVDFYTSHEALLLEYEEALCRLDSTTGLPVAGSGHMIWIGDRTRQIDGAHVEFCKGVQNPIGLKCGPSTDPDELIQLCKILNPENEPGRLTLITRFGSELISDHLPKIINSVKNAKLRVVWSCDPMHGNTIKSSNGYKTRPFEKILAEVKYFFKIHMSEGTFPGGVHVEMTGKDVTECTGGIKSIDDEDLHSRYHTACDPRLNASQSLELAFLIAEELEAFVQNS